MLSTADSPSFYQSNSPIDGLSDLNYSMNSSFEDACSVLEDANSSFEGTQLPYHDRNSGDFTLPSQSTPQGLPMPMIRDTMGMSLGPPMTVCSQNPSTLLASGTNYTWCNAGGGVDLHKSPTNDFDMDMDTDMDIDMDLNGGPKPNFRDTTVSPKDVMRHYNAPLDSVAPPQRSFSAGDTGADAQGTHFETYPLEERAQDPKRKSLPDAPSQPHWILPTLKSMRTVSQAVALPSTADQPQNSRKSQKSKKEGKSKNTTQKGTRKSKDTTENIAGKPKGKENGTAKVKRGGTEKLTEADIAAGQAVGVELEKLSDRDRFLILNKLKGKTYKEIRKQGGFHEAESTLRGRFRTLTKSREERVRKPKWREGDVSRRS